MEARRSAGQAAPGSDGFEVAGWVDTLGGFVARNRGLWRKLGDIETRLVGSALEGIEIRKPVYVAGLARSGSTILLETLAEHPDTATHRYRDYPPVYTPYLWNRWLDITPMRREQAAERTHRMAFS